MGNLYKYLFCLCVFESFFMERDLTLYHTIPSFNDPEEEGFLNYHLPQLTR